MENIICRKHDKKLWNFNGTCGGCKREEQELKDKILLYQNRQKLSNVPLRYLNASIDTLPQEHLDIISKYNFKQDILLLGKTGTGKTYTAMSLINNAIAINKTCFYIQFYSLTNLQIKEYELFKRCKGVDLLVIDEFGINDSDFKSNMLFEIVNERYNNMLPTVIISNLSLPRIKELASDALLSRLREDYILIQFTGNDLRNEINRTR